MSSTVKEHLSPQAGNITFVDGRCGRAASFDGKGFLDTGVQTKLDIDDAFALTAWIYANGEPDGSIVSEMMDNPQGKGFGLHINHGKVHANLTSVWVDDAIRVESEDTLAAGRWYHLAVTYDGSKVGDHVRLYIDGNLVRTKVLMDTLYRPYRNAGGQFNVPIRIGAGWGPERRFHGLISGVHLYSDVLSADEIAALAEADSLSNIAAKVPFS